MEITPVPEAAYALVDESNASYHKFYLFLDYAEQAVGKLPLLIDDGPDIQVFMDAQQLLTIVTSFWPSVRRAQVGQIFFEAGDPVLDSTVDELDAIAYQLFENAQYMLVSEFISQVKSQLDL